MFESIFPVMILKENAEEVIQVEKNSSIGMSHMTLVLIGPFWGMLVNWKSVLVTSGRGVQSIVMVMLKQEQTPGQALVWPCAIWKDPCSTANTRTSSPAII